MKYIKYLKENISDELKNEVLDKTEGAIVELLDKDFSITCEIEDCETYYSIDLKIQPPYVQKIDYYWDNIKENILFLTKILNKDYIINMITIRLADGAPYYIEGDIEKKIEDLYSVYDKKHLKECELYYIVLYLIKNK